MLDLGVTARDERKCRRWEAEIEEIGVERRSARTMVELGLYPTMRGTCVRACVRSAWLEHNQGPACAEAERVPDDEQGTKRGGPPADWVA